MVTTAERTEDVQTRTALRASLLQWQARNLLSRTTAEREEWLEKIAGKGIGNRWFDQVSVHGFDDTNRCHCGLELEIDWLRYTIEVTVWGESVSVNKTVFGAEELAPEVRNGIAVFTQIVKAQRLRTEWRVRYAEGVDIERIRRELGLAPAPAITWAGKVSTQSAKVAELPELTVRLLIAESTDLVPVKQDPLESRSKRRTQQVGEPPKQESPFSRLMRVFVGIPPETRR